MLLRRSTRNCSLHRLLLYWRALMLTRHDKATDHNRCHRKKRRRQACQAPRNVSSRTPVLLCNGWRRKACTDKTDLRGDRGARTIHEGVENELTRWPEIRANVRSPKRPRRQRTKAAAAFDLFSTNLKVWVLQSHFG